MKSSILASVVAYVVLTTTAVDGYLDYRGLQSRADLDASCEGEPPKLICKSCNEIAVCLCSDSGTNCTAESYRNCTAGQICRQGKCVVATVCTPEEPPEFHCRSQGMFPDPYDCKAYYFCAPCNGTKLTATRVLCGEDPVSGRKYGYNPVTQVCSNALTNGECASLPIPVCKRPFETGIVGGNSYIYYTCLNVIKDGKLTTTLYPYQDNCSFGRRYVVATETCT